MSSKKPGSRSYPDLLFFGKTIRILSGGWAALDTMSLADGLARITLDLENGEDAPSFASLPPAPQIEDLRRGLRSDRSLFLSAAAYLDQLPPRTPALLEELRSCYLATVALLQARKTIQSEGIESVGRIPDPATSGGFLQIRKDEDQITITSAFRSLVTGTNGLSLRLPLPAPAKKQP